MTRHAMRFIRLKQEILHELTQLDALETELTQIEGRGDSIPSPVRVRALASLLHDFYTGCERIFERIAQEFDGGLPSDASWHGRLLTAMTLDLPTIRPAVIRKETAEGLQDFLAFRHRFRHMYGFELDDNRLMPLLQTMARAKEDIKADLMRFIAHQEEVLGDDR